MWSLLKSLFCKHVNRGIELVTEVHDGIEYMSWTGPMIVCKDCRKKLAYTSVSPEQRKALEKDYYANI